MVHPYLRRRRGEEPVTYAHPSLRSALEETCGVIVFQEQVIAVARDMAGLSAGRAELLRRALGHKRATEQLERFRQEFLSGALDNGISSQIAQAVWQQIIAFGSYSFAKSHAMSFAVIVYQSAWLRCYFPAEFFAGVLNNQPMGFYSPRVVAADAQRHGVEVRPVDIVASDVHVAVEERNVIRLGFGIVKGIGDLAGQRIFKARTAGPFVSLKDFCHRTRLARGEVEGLIQAGAFDRWGVSRRRLLWELEAALKTSERPVLTLESKAKAPTFDPLSEYERIWTEMSQTGVNAGVHLTKLVEKQLQKIGVIPSYKLDKVPNGSQVIIGGVIASAQRPPTAKGVGFLSVEDQWGHTNVVLKPEVYEMYRPLLRGPFVAIKGIVQNHYGAVSILAEKIAPIRPRAE